eukprot:gene7326-biopygen4573
MSRCTQHRRRGTRAAAHQDVGGDGDGRCRVRRVRLQQRPAVQQPTFEEVGDHHPPHQIPAPIRAGGPFRRSPSSSPTAWRNDGSEPKSVPQRSVIVRGAGPGGELGAPAGARRSVMGPPQHHPVRRGGPRAPAECAWVGECRNDCPR